MNKYLSKDDIYALELIHQEVTDSELKDKLLEIYIQSLRKDEHYYRREKLKHKSMDQDEDFKALIVGQLSKLVPSVHTQVLYHEITKELYHAIRQLTPTERNVIWLFFFCDFSLTEIGKITGVSQQAVSKTVKRSLSKLRKSKKIKKFSKMGCEITWKLRLLLKR